MTKTTRNGSLQNNHSNYTKEGKSDVDGIEEETLIHKQDMTHYVTRRGGRNSYLLPNHGSEKEDRELIKETHTQKGGNVARNEEDNQAANG